MQKEYDALTTKRTITKTATAKEGENVKNITYKQINSNSETDVVTLFTRLEEMVSQEAKNNEPLK